MDRDQVLAILRAHESELRAAGVERLCLFGSVARRDQTPESDVDLAVEMQSAKKWTLLTLGGLQMDLSDWLKVKVDLSVLDWLRPSIRDRVLGEAIDAL